MTDRFVASAKAGEGGRTDYFDAVTRGLVLRVSAGGHRTWSYFFTSPATGKRARVALGDYPAVTLADARGKTLEHATQVADRDDPREVKRAEERARAGSATTVSRLIDLYVADPEKAALRSIDEIARRLRRNVVPVIGDAGLSALRRRDVRDVTEGIARRGAPIEAARVFEDIRAMLRWAVQHDYLDNSPIEGMAKPAGSKPRERVLSDGEIATLWTGLAAALPRSVQCQRIIRLCLITGQRVGEVAGMTRGELDLPTREWRLPGSRTKNGYPHVVPLSDLASAIVRQALADVSDGEFLFPCGKDHLSGAAVARTIVRANDADENRPLGRFGIASWSAHDLRRTCLTNMARLGVAPHVIGAVANHRSVTKASVTMAHYVTYSYAPEKRAALDLWAERLAAIVGGGAAKVVPLRAGQ
jgi:integrase